jgi:cyanophycinase
VLPPIHLLADSSLLFKDGGALLRRLAESIAAEKPSAAFIGAASGDDPNAYAIFEAAMDMAGIESRRHVGARYSAMDHICLSAADLIVIGGGDPARGIEIMRATDMLATVVQRFLGGALLVGVSAGAVLIGEEVPGEPAVQGMNLVPFVVGVHDESDDFASLRQAVAAKPGRRGIGIPFGGGVLFHRPNVLEPIGKALVELIEVGGEVRQALLMTGERQDA